MNNDKSEIPEGVTPLESDEIEGLIPTHITTRDELNRVEQENIRQAVVWLQTQRQKQVISEAFLCKLHQRMFGDVWKWAGEYRTSNKNIGVPREQISVELRKLVDDTQYWIDHSTYAPDEITARFHHRLVWIHSFVNGNGRHARLMADVLLEKIFGLKLFSWGRMGLVDENKTRRAYIDALRTADKGDYRLLLGFVRS